MSRTTRSERSTATAARAASASTSLTSSALKRRSPGGPQHLVVGDDRSDRAVANEERREDTRGRHRQPHELCQLAGEVLVDLGIVDERVDPERPPPGERPARHRPDDGNGHAHGLGEIVVVVGGLDPKLAVGRGKGDEHGPGADELAETTADQLEHPREVEIGDERLADLLHRLELSHPPRERLVETCVLDRHRGLRGEHDRDLLVLLGEVRVALLLRQVEVSVDRSAQEDRHAEEGLHLGMARREADRARILAEVVEPKRPGVLDESAEDPPADGQVTDLLRCGLVEATVDEALEPFPGAVDDAERHVAGARQAYRRLEQLLENGLERELGGQQDADLDESPQPLFLCDHPTFRRNGSSRTPAPRAGAGRRGYRARPRQPATCRASPVSCSITTRGCALSKTNTASRSVRYTRWSDRSVPSGSNGGPSATSSRARSRVPSASGATTTRWLAESATATDWSAEPFGELAQHTGLVGVAEEQRLRAPALEDEGRPPG